MKNITIYFLLCTISVVACKKQHRSDSIEGTWRLVTVYDKVENGTVEVPKPMGATGDALLKFGKANAFSVSTFGMSYKGTYSLVNNADLNFTATEFSGSNSEEWSQAVSVIISSCGLQSIHPCEPNKIIQSGNRLTINSALRYNLAFERVQ